ncbi:serine/threonine-protein kinase [Micrococcaceae bacterium Sec5.7]
MDDFRQGGTSEEMTPDVPGYSVGRQLGRGGSATVWLVTEELTGRDFALKCFVPDLDGPHAATPDTDASRAAVPDWSTAEDSVRREVRILSVLDHQHLVKAYDVVRVTGAADRRLGLVMDYAPGGSLGQLIASRGRLSIGETVTVITPLAQVLGYLHGKGFTHSDVSPGNVLFSGHGKPMLADVGIARMVGDAAGVSDHGTEGFMDPAPLDAVRAGLQPERDIYSVAALGWYCLTGHAPRKAADRPPLSLLIPEVPAELAAALEAGLSENRRLRPTAAELATVIYRSASPAPVDLSGSVHPTVIPELLTRRHAPDASSGLPREQIRALGRRLSTSRCAGLLGMRRVVPDHVSRDPAALDAAPGQPGACPELPLRRSHRLEPARPRRWPFIAALPVAVVGVALAGAWWISGQPPVAGAQRPPASSAGSETASGDAQPENIVPQSIRAQLRSRDPREAVRGLAWIRSTAFSSGWFELLDEVNVRDSAAAAADEKIVSLLREKGHVLAGFTTTLAAVESQPESNASRAVVGVRSGTSAYEEKDAAGAVVAAGHAAADQQLRLVLVPVDGLWRIVEILPAA